MKNMRLIPAFLAFLGVCAAMQGVWMLMADNPMTIAPVFTLIGELFLLLAILVLFCIVLVVCVSSFVYAFHFGDDEGTIIGLAVTGIIGWIFSMALFAPIDATPGGSAHLDSSVQFAVIGWWVLVIALAALRGWVSRGRKPRDTA